MAISRPGPDEVIPVIYESVFDPPKLQVALGAATRCLGAKSALLVTPGLPPENGGLCVLDQIDVACVRDYAAHFSQQDLWSQSAYQRFGVGKMPAVTGSELVSEQRLLCSEFYNDFLRPQSVCDVLVTEFSIDASPPPIALAFHRARNTGSFTNRDKRYLGRIAGHFRHALQLATRAQSLAALSVDVLEAIGGGVIIVAADCRVMHVTRAALRSLGPGDTLQIRCGRLRAGNSADDALLQTLCRDADRNTVPVGRLVLGGKGPGQPIALRAYPLPIGAAARALAPVERPQLLLIIDEPEQAGSGLGGLASRFGLTEAEINLCRSLLTGETISAFAEKSCVSLNTARTHLKHVFAKTEIHRQADLLRMLSGAR